MIAVQWVEVVEFLGFLAFGLFLVVVFLLIVVMASPVKK